MNAKLPMNLQFFGETATGVTEIPTTSQAPTSPNIDYEKLSQIVQGKQAATEDSVLKGYLKQQGLSKEDMDQAILTFKQQKAAQQPPDVNELQQQITQAKTATQQAMLEKDATLMALSLGLDVKTIPYLLKLADLSSVMGADGKYSGDAIKAALNKVLEDVPQLKTVTTQATGFTQIGVTGSQAATQTTDDALKAIFGIKK